MLVFSLAERKLEVLAALEEAGEDVVSLTLVDWPKNKQEGSDFGKAKKKVYYVKTVFVLDLDDLNDSILFLWCLYMLGSTRDK